MKDDRGTAFSGDQGDEKCNEYSVRKHVRRNHLGNINTKMYNTKIDLQQIGIQYADYIQPVP